MKNWYLVIGKLIKSKTKLNQNDSYELLNSIMALLEKYGFTDSDWWCEIEPGDPRYDFKYIGRGVK